MGSHQSTRVGVYLVASDPIMKSITKSIGKKCTKCNKRALNIDNFCEVHGATLEEAFETKQYIARSDKLENHEDERLSNISCWLPSRKDKSQIYVANISHNGEFDYSLLDYDNGGVLSLADLDQQKYIDAFKVAFQETIEEIAKAFKTLKFEFGVIQYWA